jgi:Flp pilus assembly protein TadG
MRHRQRGQALIETVIFLPVALIALFGIMYFSRYGVLSERAQSAVRYGTLVSYRAAPVYSARGIYDAIATGPVPPTACPASIGTDTKNALSEQNGAGPTPSPYWRPDSATATCTQSTVSFAGAPTAAFHIFTVTASTATATIAVPTALTGLLGANTSAVASFGYVRSDPPSVIMYCIPALGTSVAAALGGAVYGVGGAC